MELIEQWLIIIFLPLVGVFFVVVITSRVRDYVGTRKGIEKKPKTKKGKLKVRKTDLIEEVKQLERIKRDLNSDIKHCQYQARKERQNLRDIVEANKARNGDDIKSLKDDMINITTDMVNNFKRRTTLEVFSIDITHHVDIPNPKITLKIK